MKGVNRVVSANDSCDGARANSICRRAPARPWNRLREDVRGAAPTGPGPGPCGHTISHGARQLEAAAPPPAAQPSLCDGGERAATERPTDRLPPSCCQPAPGARLPSSGRAYRAPPVRRHAPCARRPARGLAGRTRKILARLGPANSEPELGAGAPLRIRPSPLRNECPSLMSAAPVLRVCAGPDPLHTGLPGLPAPAPARIVSRGGENRTGLRLRRGSGSAAAHAADGLPESGPAPAAPVSVPPPSLSTRVQRACRRVLRCWGLGWPLSPRVPSRPLPTRIQSSAHRAASRAARGRRGGSTMQAPVSHRLHGRTQRPPCRGIGGCRIRRRRGWPSAPVPDVPCVK